MSVERFMGNYPSRDLRVEVLAEQQRKRDGNPTLIYFTKQLIAAATDGIHEAERRLDRFGRSAGVLDRDSGSELFAEAPYDYSAILFGHAVLGLGEMLVTGEFDYYNFEVGVNSAFFGTRLAPLALSGETAEQIPTDRFELMQKSRARDGTYTEFFQNPEQLLPSRLLRIFKTYGGYLDFLTRSGFLTNWQERAGQLIPDNTNSTSPGYEPGPMAEAVSGGTHGLYPQVERDIRAILEEIEF